MKNHDAYRYERKYLAEGMSVKQVELLLRRHPALFSEIYHARWINNVYLDSVNLACLASSIDGARDRTKTRIRWYGDIFGEVERPILELKIKRGLLGLKKSFSLPKFAFGISTSGRAIEEMLCHSDLRPEVLVQIRRLRPMLVNRYFRSYFRSADGNFRITLDTGIRSHAIRTIGNRFIGWWHQPADVVVELKYDTAVESGAAAITQHLPFRLTRNSKYVNGVLGAYRLKVG